MIEATEIQREFIHGKKFDEQWKALGLTDDNLKELQTITSILRFTA